MTSKPVWIWLPGQTQPVRAGTFTLAGTAAIPLGSFAYDKAYVERTDRIALDERQLRGFRGMAKTTDYQGVFDILRDVTPEGFGLDMLLRRRAVTSMSALDTLEYAEGDSVGAVVVCDDIDTKMAFVPRSSQDMFDVMDDTEPAQPGAHIITRLHGLPSTSLGGERPKITVTHKGQWWMAKFAGSKDAPSSPLREYLCMKLAREAGIEAAEVEFIQRKGRGTVLVKRFDRHWNADGRLERLHFASGATMLGAAAAGRDAPGRTYINMGLNALRWGVQQHLPELWRRMAFNVLIGNGDDHPRNHGFLRRGSGWCLAPAYDIAPYTPNGGQVMDVRALSMGVLRNGDAAATADHLLRAARQFGLDYQMANDYLDSTWQLIHDRWARLAQDVGTQPLERPLFDLPPRTQRISESAWRKARAR
ncbi:type II toxin-antitoxin system HipA family toxin [Delftia sp. PS-11]|uniref:type II toxin-antitoxin system HipA family toxin n=1 Tax=Delftia sp. PS-11 TaxID=2767222 RepID=UPI0024539BE5|nr:type II toxin-antitoxin system HipA family toxin [Delftia sp. PS-11]KAJ8745783.1 type II toxin-antitoxin system HipA family toxin [Delftia sp. PS-11]